MARAREAINLGLKLLQIERNRLKVDLPRPGPITLRSPRTGLAAVVSVHGEELDTATARQRQFQRPQDNHQLTSRFMTHKAIWPINFERDAPKGKRFPLGENNLIGLIHADGNGLGELLRVISRACAQVDDDIYIKLYRRFSDVVTSATLRATHEASTTVLSPRRVDGVIPARPLVLGGDDLLLITRADLAIPFAREWLDAFERYSREAMYSLVESFENAGLQSHSAELPTRLTACAGICFMKASQPFRTGHELSESLCSRAKAHSRQARTEDGLIPSSLAWHKVQESLIQDAEALFERNHRLIDGDTSLETSISAYALHRDQGLPALGDLYDIVAAFDSGLNDRPLRELATLLRCSLSLAEQAYKRWRQLAYKNAGPQLERFDLALQRILGKVREDLPFSQGDVGRSPLEDIISLRTIMSTTTIEGTTHA